MLYYNHTKEVIKMIYYANIKTLRCNAEEIKEAINFMENNNLVEECCVDWKHFKENNEYMADEWGQNINPKYKELSLEWYKVSHLDERFNSTVEFSFWG